MDGPPPPEEDFTSLPVADRLAHKNWKARVSGYDALIKTFQNTASDSDPAFRPYLGNGELLKKIVADTNAVAQEKGVEVVVALVKFAGENAARTREEVMPAVVDKCLGSTRAGTRTQAIELVLQYVEMENSADGSIRDILVGLGAKQPKTVAGCVTAVKEIVRVFGIQPVSPQLVLKALLKIFGHSDKTVRAEGTALCQLIYQCIGAAIQPSLADLKPVQVKELTESFEKMDADSKGKGTLVPERYTRQEARKREAAPPDAGDGAAAAEPEEIDPRSFAEEVNIVPQIPANFYANLASSKWKERKEALDELLAVLQKVVRIQDAPDLAELIKGLASKMADVNIACVITAANCLEAIAKGLMEPFARHKEAVFPPMFARLKERKATVSDAIGAALDAAFATTTISDVLELILPPLSDKSPQVKEGTVKFIHRALSNATKPPGPAQVKPLADALVVALADGSGPVRDGAAQSLGCLMKIVGERAMNPILEPLDDLRKSKVKEEFEKATVKCKVGPPKPAAPPPSAAPPKKKAPAKKADPPPKAASPPPEDDEPPPKPKGPPARLAAKKPPAAAAPAAAAKKPPAAAAAAAASSKGGPAPGALDTFKYKHTPETAEELAVDMIPESIATGLSDALWKPRLAAAEEMLAWLESGEVDTVDSEVVVRFLGKKVWNDKNFQVSAKIYQVLNLLAERCPSFGRSSVALAVGHLSEKLGDMKLKKPAGETLGIFAEKTSLSFVLNQAYEPMGKQKAPKVIADSISWINTSLQEFGIAGLSLRPLIEFLKEGLKNSNSAPRTSATACLVTLKLFAGSSIKDLIQDLNPQLLATIVSDFDKADGTPAPTPTRFSAEVAAAPSGGGGKAASSDPLDDLFPRVELDKLLVGTTILADANSDVWKARKEALEQLQGLLDIGQNKRLKPVMGEIKEVLKSRVVDTNKAVQLIALDIVSRVATGMNKPFEKFARFFVASVCSVLADQKPHIRSAGLTTLSAIATACEGIGPVVPGAATGLETANPALRSALAGWLGDQLKELNGAPLPDLAPLAAPLVLCLDDKNGEVRKTAQVVVPYVIAQVGFDKVASETSNLKPASRGGVMALLQTAKANIPAGVGAPPPAAAAPKGPAKSASAAPAAPAPPVAERSASPAPGPARPGAIRATGLRRAPAASAAASTAPSRPESRAESEISATSAPVSKLSKSTGPGLRRPANAAAPPPPPPAAHPVGFFIGANLDAKRARVAKDVGRWVVEGAPVKKDIGDVLHHQMEGHVAEDVLKHLFSGGHDAVGDYIIGIGEMSESFIAALAGESDEVFGDTLRTTLLANIDLPLKYLSLRIHEPPPNLVGKCLDLLETILAFLRSVEYQFTDPEAQCFIPTIIHKLGDAREPVRNRVAIIIQSLPRVYAYSRVFQLLLEHGLKSKVAKTRQGTLDELGGILKRSGMGACDPPKSLPQIAIMISDKDPSVRKSALGTLGEAYSHVGDKIWGYVGTLAAKEKTQLEERLRRIPAPPGAAPVEPPPNAAPIPRATPAMSRIGAFARPASPAGLPTRSASPAPVAASSRLAGASTRAVSPGPTSPTTGMRPPSMIGAGRGTRPTSMMPSRLAAPRSLAKPVPVQPPPSEEPDLYPINGAANGHDEYEDPAPGPAASASDDVTITISSILSNDPGRSVEALKKIQKILEVAPESSHSSPQFRDLSEHTEGLIETVTLQMQQIFENVDALTENASFRLAKHLIQTLNSFCDHSILAESLSVDTLQSLLEELTKRLLHTDESKEPKIKDLSRFINMLILRLFAVAKRVSIFRALFGLLLQLVKPFPQRGTPADAEDARTAELVLKCVWKLARNIPGDLQKGALDPVELFPAIEHFLQSIPPNEWRARATNRVPSGDMPLRTIKVIIQHIVAHFGQDDTYEVLTQAFDDPSATIVYPYVFRILNSSARNAVAAGSESATSPRARTRSVVQLNDTADHGRRSPSPVRSAVSTSSIGRNASPSPTRSRSPARTRPVTPPPPAHGSPSPQEEEDPDVLLLKIIDHISSETTGALHKEGITELHKFLKKYPTKKPKVDKLLEATGPAFRKYLARALASRAAEDPDREPAPTPVPVPMEVSTQRVEAVRRDISPPSVPASPSSRRRMDSTAAARRASVIDPTLPGGERLSRLHDIFQYRHAAAARDEQRGNRASMGSNGSGGGHATDG